MNVLMLSMLRGALRRDIWEANSAALSEDVLTNSDVRTLIHYIGELHEERTGDLTPTDLEMTIESKYRRPDGRKPELLELVGMLSTIEDMPFEELQPRISDFLGRELANKAMIYIASREDSDRFDLQYPLEMLTKAVELASGVDLGVDDIQLADAPSAEAERLRVCTVGLGPRMDRHLGGGHGQGEMLIWLAPPGVGKTSLLISQGVEMAKQGEHVLHISLEINGAKCRQRVDQKLTGLDREERLARPKAVMAARRAMKGKFYVKDWCAKNVTVDDIRTLVRNMRAQGQEVSAICVDYLELMSPIRVNKHGERFNHSQNAKDLRRLGNELGVKMSTAWQVTRAGAEKHVIGAVDVSECWDIVKHADIIMGLNQSVEELANHVLRINIIKQRESTVRPTEYYYSNLDRMIIREQGEGDNDEPPEDVGDRDRSGVRKHRSGVTLGL